MNATEAKERPILFSGEMVRAILEGRKTQTRRVAKFKPLHDGLNLGFSGLEADDQGVCGWALASRDGMGTWNERTYLLRCPYGQPGDRLWVRETFRTVGRRHRGTERRSLLYPATCAPGTVRGPLKPSIFMPRWASRITLEIVKIRVEKIQRLTEADAIEEGAMGLDTHLKQTAARVAAYEGRHQIGPVDYFRQLWNQLNSGRGYGWDANPWVWVVEFRKVA